MTDQIDLNSECLSNILKLHFETYTLFIKNHQIDLRVNNSLLIYDEKNFKTTSTFGRFSMFIFVLKSVNNYENILQILYQTWYFNSRAKYIMLLLSEDEEEMNKIFKVSWKYFIYNITVIFNGVLFSFFPYGEKNCGKYVNYENISTCEELDDVFPEKIPLDLHGCEVKMMPFIIPPFVMDYNNTHTRYDVTVPRND